MFSVQIRSHDVEYKTQQQDQSTKWSVSVFIQKYIIIYHQSLVSVLIPCHYIRPLDLSMKSRERQKEKKQNATVGTFGDLCDQAVDKTFQDKEFMKYAKSTKR